MLAIRLPEDIEKRLHDLARRTGRTKTFYAREAILGHLKEIENLYLAERTMLAKKTVGRSGPETANHHEQAPRASRSGASSFVSRWQGRFQPAAKSDARYRALEKKYL
jgi:RHH-type transcriptional regulator, rel operon repressor / antitoxin RelB